MAQGNELVLQKLKLNSEILVPSQIAGGIDGTVYRLITDTDTQSGYDGIVGTIQWCQFLVVKPVLDIFECQKCVQIEVFCTASL